MKCFPFFLPILFCMPIVLFSGSKVINVLFK
jgi:hypothetical protein